MNKNINKFSTVIDKNTFYFYNPVFQEKYESYINSLSETLLVLKNSIETQGLKKSIFENLLHEKENGLKVLLTLTGFANDNLRIAPPLTINKKQILELFKSLQKSL